MTNDNHHSPRLQGAKPQRTVCDEPLATTQGEAKGSGRVHVRVTSFRSRLIDPDNIAAKYLVDCCRYAGLIVDDTAAQIEYSCSQIKCKKGEEKTVITIGKI